MTRDEINSVELTEKQKKSNDAFIFLSKLAKLLNDGWEPEQAEKYYYMLYRKGSWSKHDKAHKEIEWCNGFYSPGCPEIRICSSIYFKSFELIEKARTEFYQDWRDLFMAEED